MPIHSELSSLEWLEDFGRQQRWQHDRPIERLDPASSLTRCTDELDRIEAENQLGPQTEGERVGRQLGEIDWICELRTLINGH